MRVPTYNIKYMDTPERKEFDLRRDGLREIPSLGWCGSLQTQPDRPLHHHFGALEIHFLERGHKFYKVGGRELELHGGDLFITLPSESHSTGGRPVESCAAYWVHVFLPKRGQSFLSLPPQEAAALAEALRSLPSRHFRASTRAKFLFGRLLDLRSEAETALRPTRLRQAMIELLLEIIDSSISVRRIRGDRGSIMREVARTIENRATEDFRMKDMARLAGYSLSHFKLAFKEETGLSPRQFILRARVKIACHRLATTRDPIGKIALDLGFSTSEYFATVFRRLIGDSPRQYRKNGARRSGPSHRKDDGQS
jgi:AraC-like DNA-binding protein